LLRINISIIKYHLRITKGDYVEKDMMIGHIGQILKPMKENDIVEDVENYENKIVPKEKRRPNSVKEKKMFDSGL